MNAFQKKAIFLSLLIALSVTLWRKGEHEYIKPAHQVSWLHYKKDDSGKLVKNIVPTKEITELTTATVSAENASKRAPANSEKSNMETDNKNVVFLNLGKPNVKPELNELTFINSYNPEWKELLAKELMLFQPESVEVFFKPHKSVVKIMENNQAMFLEEVSVTYKTNLGPRSFKAFINSENGKIVETWERTHYDNFSPRMPASENQGLSPTGTL